MTSSRPEPLRLFRSLSLRRWALLLGAPGADVVVTPIVTHALERGDDAVRSSWRRWRRRRRHRDDDPRLQEISEALQGLDRYGGLIEELRTAVLESLGEGEEERAHRREIDTVFAEHLRLRNELVEANLGLVHMAVQRLRVDPELHGDLVHEGLFGLLRALERYEPARGIRFSTYAMYWVRSEVVAAYTERLREIRVPRHLLAQRRAFLRELERLDRGQANAQLRDEARRAANLTESQLRAVERIPTVDGMANAPESTESPIDLDAGRDAANLRPALASLDPRALTIVQHRFELDGKPFLTLNRLGRRLGISRERVRQIEIAALERLHHHLRPLPAAERTAA